MPKPDELTERVARLERAIAASDTNIHQYDTPEQAAAWTAELEANRAAEVKAQEEAAAAVAKAQAEADLAQAEADAAGAAEAVQAAKDAAKAATKGA